MPATKKQPLLSWEDCKWSLGKLWITSAAVFFGAMLFLSLIDRFEMVPRGKKDSQLMELAKAYLEPTKTAWKWAMNAILPSISLIIGALLSNLGSLPSKKSMVVELRQFRLAYGVSAFYLGTVFVILVASLSIDTLAVDVLDSSAIWLAPFQGISSTVLSVFYVRAALAEPPPSKDNS